MFVTTRPVPGVARGNAQYSDLCESKYSKASQDAKGMSTLIVKSLLCVETLTPLCVTSLKQPSSEACYSDQCISVGHVLVEKQAVWQSAMYWLNQGSTMCWGRGSCQGGVKGTCARPKSPLTLWTGSTEQRIHNYGPNRDLTSVQIETATSIK